MSVTAQQLYEAMKAEGIIGPFLWEILLPCQREIYERLAAKINALMPRK